MGCGDVVSVGLLCGLFVVMQHGTPAPLWCRFEAGIAASASLSSRGMPSKNSFAAGLGADAPVHVPFQVRAADTEAVNPQWHNIFLKAFCPCDVICACMSVIDTPAYAAVQVVLQTASSFS